MSKQIAIRYTDEEYKELIKRVKESKLFYVLQGKKHPNIAQYVRQVTLK